MNNYKKSQLFILGNLPETKKQEVRIYECIMVIKKLFFAVLVIVYAWNANAQNNAKLVNTFIGTEGTGHTFPGPSLPFGMVQPGPDNALSLIHI
jgi:putative alpha-1,2-mannosidase